jgi:hypothetical protein
MRGAWPCLPVQMVLTPVTDGQFGDLRLQCPKTRSPALPAEIDVPAGGWSAFPRAEVVGGPVEARVTKQALKRGHLQFPHYSG